jgi:hypothetical protein
VNRRRYAALLWVARNLPWVWRHVISAPTRLAWVDAAASEAHVRRLERILEPPSTEEPTHDHDRPGT